MKKIAILGGGPAGCQCALWLKQLGFEPFIIEKTKQLGGLQTQSPYPNTWMAGVRNHTGKMFAKEMQRQIEEMDIKVFLNTTITAFLRLSSEFEIAIDKKKLKAKAIVIATGVIAKQFSFHEDEHTLIGPGQHIFDYDFKNKRVAILGGGDNAAENYAMIMQQHPACCHIYARTVRARKNLWSKVQPYDVFYSPYQYEQETQTIQHENAQREYDVVLVMYGWEANFPDAFSSLKHLLINAQGFIHTDQNCQTPVADIYAIGEVANRMHPCVVTAMADGVTAAKAIQYFFE